MAIIKVLELIYPTFFPKNTSKVSFYSRAAASLRLLWVQGGTDDTIDFFGHAYFNFGMPCNYLGSFGHFENFWKFSQHFPIFRFIISSCFNWCYSAAGRCKTWFYLMLFWKLVVPGPPLDPALKAPRASAAATIRLLTSKTTFYNDQPRYNINLKKLKKSKKYWGNFQKFSICPKELQ